MPAQVAANGRERLAEFVREHRAQLPDNARALQAVEPRARLAHLFAGGLFALECGAEVGGAAPDELLESCEVQDPGGEKPEEQEDAASGLVPDAFERPMVEIGEGTGLERAEEVVDAVELSRDRDGEAARRHVGLEVEKEHCDMLRDDGRRVRHARDRPSRIHVGRVAAAERLGAKAGLVVDDGPAARELGMALRDGLGHAGAKKACVGSALDDRSQDLDGTVVGFGDGAEEFVGPEACGGDLAHVEHVCHEVRAARRDGRHTFESGEVRNVGSPAPDDDHASNAAVRIGKGPGRDGADVARAHRTHLHEEAGAAEKELDLAFSHRFGERFGRVKARNDPETG